MATKERVYAGDTFSVVFECRKTDIDNVKRNSNGLPDEPANAYAKVYNTLDEVYLEVGGVGDITAPVTIVPMDLDTNRGALMKFTVDSEFTIEIGDYTLILTAEFADGAVETKTVKYKVIEQR